MSARFYDAREHAQTALESYVSYATAVEKKDFSSARLYYQAAKCSQQAAELILNFTFRDFELAQHLKNAALSFTNAAEATDFNMIEKESREANKHLQHFEALQKEINLKTQKNS
jgi:hypothetical protein